MLTILIICVAFFVLAFVGLNHFLSTVLGLASVVGLIFGLYLIWLGFSFESMNSFGWGCVLIIGSAGVLFYLRTCFGD
jgi:hypothetical protein